ncbi:unnamed protein product [Menidia menidia]|uniref:(Atlantic silverside) hypothetical protein n=1 Tax=Menidia menidia TaxID=238744 RepID=A0A8S4BKU0_9TELE|nr:unnamed protein product [Menidia menidia]
MHLANAALQHLFVRKSFRPFKCSHCGKAFREKEKLDVHVRVHGREASAFSCHICSQGFISDAALEEHLLLHAETRSYSCLLCPESFERLEVLREHVEVVLLRVEVSPGGSAPCGGFSRSVGGFFTCVDPGVVPEDSDTWMCCTWMECWL